MRNISEERMWKYFLVFNCNMLSVFQGTTPSSCGGLHRQRLGLSDMLTWTLGNMYLRVLLLLLYYYYYGNLYLRVLLLLLHHMYYTLYSQQPGVDPRMMNYGSDICHSLYYYCCCCCLRADNSLDFQTNPAV